MIILFVLFLLQFSLACACLAVNGEQKDQLAEHGWAASSNYTRADVQSQFDCCGFRDVNLPPKERLGHPNCLNSSHCCADSNAPCCTGIYPNTSAAGTAPPSCPCDTCFSKLQVKIYNAFSATGGVGLFFSFTEIIGVWLALRYRNQKDPQANPSAFL
ncbi:cyclin-dependent kinase 4 [Plakobranchus ocellatus]|uniref:Cyclin-dependent kinase 4 n=1 Tax=Plakobranchus ocellatus TaxID=259542 RepID=A0AAV3XZC1_9GAST|nr:cyclin-dependent kinase 4 [Plakobranchus ocellatus]